ncbi:trigger factor [Sulfitobacter mediterraneus]|uniref:trigger factor n=1 Tax=Sulfitobacter mediterraneus TaxID=83219 RepID=UPI001934AB1F|nr:trigger factor [Sulfitobacter mediterraneus]MBM1631739.1 trigger factor [Sulfitobacter mediterraneus]MBM1639554.1 trigger factor [Sulfitobacter mediterraneus]MBM1643603.1 trigger factor [Sulfitobacter mediterraneus]MBM1647649.1 trigger factor [Sulfitobacter mediterraneus]MBM1651694.1 trigger factor [Sulfitobacter mediterraneus]
MQVNETLNEGLKRGYAITLTAAELDAKVNEKLAEAQPEVEMKGFRKGKVPMALLKKQFGQRVMGEAMQESIDGAMNEHFEKSGDRPAMQPEVKMANEDWKEGDDVEVTMTYEALPEIPELDMSKIKLEKLVVKADDAAVDEALANLAETAQDFKARKKGSKAKDGDQVVMDFVGKVDGEAFEGGSAEDYPLVLGSNSFIPGFEEQLVGVKAGEEKAVTVSFPDDYQAEHLKGKEATFDCTIKEVKEPVAAEIDDELAKKFGAEDLAGLKAQIAERLEAEYAGASRAVMKRGLLDQLDSMVDFDLPPTLVETEAGQIAHQLWHDENPDVEGHDHPEIETKEEHTKLATRRVRLGLLLAELGQKAEVQVTDAEMTQAIMNQARQYPGQERQFFEFVQQNQQMQQQLRAPLFEDKVIDHIAENAEVTEKEISKDDLQKAVEALEDE